MAESTRPLSASIVGGLASMGRGLGGALSGLQSAVVPEVFYKGDYSPEQWQNWYADTRPGGKHHARHQEFLQRLEPVLERRFGEFKQAIAQGWQPEDFATITATDRPMSQVMEKARDVIRGKPVGDDPEAKQWAKWFLDYTRQQSLGGLNSEADNPVTPEQFADWGKPSGVPSSVGGLVNDLRSSMNAPYRLTDEGSENLERLIDYNLMTTFQTDPAHRPEYLKSGYGMGMIQNAVGMFYPSGISMAAQQMGNVASASPVSAVDNALMWDDYSRQKFAENPNSWNDFISGSTIPQASALTAGGMERKFQGGDAAMGRAARWLTNPMLFPKESEQERQTRFELASKEDRFTPIRPAPDPSDPLGEEKARIRKQLAQQARQAEAEAWSGFSTVLPEQIRELNKATGLNIKPFYPPAAVNDVAMVVPGILGDPQNLAQTAIRAVTGGLPGLGASLLSSLYEAPGEAGFNAAMTLGNTPQSMQDYFTKPDPNVPLRTPDGRIPAPDSQEYVSALNEYRTNQRKVLGQAAELFKNDQRKAQKRQKPASFMESEVFLQPY